MLAKRSLLSAAVLMMLLASSCVHNKQPGAGVDAISTDLQYKALQQKNAAPANFVPPAIPSLPPQPTLAPFTQPTFPPFESSNIACPTAAPTAEAQQDVTDNITSVPQAGDFIWRVDGRELYKGTPLPLPHQTKRTILNVQGTANANAQNFSYETTEKELSATGNAGEVHSYFSVSSQTASDNTVRETQQGHTVNSGRTSTAGLRLTELKVTNLGTTTTFIPNQPIRYLITPVVEGPDHPWNDSVVDASSDPSNPQSYKASSYVKGRVTIDACGERLRGWLVTSDQTYSSGGVSVTRHVEYGVATQMGGIVIYENVKSPCTEQSNGKCQEGNPTLEYTANYGKKI